MRIRILSDEPVSPNFPGGADCCAFVQMTQRENGDVLCLYRRGSAKHGPDGALVAQRSPDRGQTWGAPLTVFDEADHTPPNSVVCGGIAALGDTLISSYCYVEMLNPDAYVFGDEGSRFPRHICISRSEDAGRTWSEPVEIGAPEFAGRAGTASSPFPLGDGGLCVPLEIQTEQGPQGTAAVFSSDGGRTFSEPRLLVADETGALSLCDARFARLRDGTHLMHLWAFRHDTEETISVHESRSLDGMTWGKAHATGIHGQISQPLELPSGTIISICNHRQYPEGNQFWWSTDGGRAWDERPIQMWSVRESRMLGEPADERRVADKEEVWDSLPSFSFGTPALLLADDDTVLLTYYGTVDNVIHVRACRFRVEE